MVFLVVWKSSNVLIILNGNPVFFSISGVYICFWVAFIISLYLYQAVLEILINLKIYKPKSSNKPYYFLNKKQLQTEIWDVVR